MNWTWLGRSPLDLHLIRQRLSWFLFKRNKRAQIQVSALLIFTWKCWNHDAHWKRIKRAVRIACTNTVFLDGNLLPYEICRKKKNDFLFISIWKVTRFISEAATRTFAPFFYLNKTPEQQEIVAQFFVIISVIHTTRAENSLLPNKTKRFPDEFTPRVQTNRPNVRKNL